MGMKLPPDVEAKILQSATVKPSPWIERPSNPSNSSQVSLGLQLWDKMPEKDFQAVIVKYAKNLKWFPYHTFDSRRSDEGYPDLTLFRERAVWLELKSANGKTSKVQQAFREAIERAGGEYHLLRPCDWQRIEEILK